MAACRLPPRPTTLLLRPGVPVVRRDADTLQVGLHPPRVAQVPDAPEVRALLDALRVGVGPDELTGDGCPGAGEPAGGRSGLCGRTGDHRRTRRSPRRSTAPAASGASPPAPATGSASGPPGRRTRSSPTCWHCAGLEVDDVSPAVWLVVAPGPIVRESHRPAGSRGCAAPVGERRRGGRRIGPFVEPGRTACLRCVDAHEAEADPRRPFLVEQAALASAGGEPVDPVLDRLALAWAVRDLCRYLEGDEPSTWSATVDVGPTERTAPGALAAPSRAAAAPGTCLFDLP